MNAFGPSDMFNPALLSMSVSPAYSTVGMAFCLFWRRYFVAILLGHLYVC